MIDIMDNVLELNDVVIFANGQHIKHGIITKITDFGWGEKCDVSITRQYTDGTPYTYNETVYKQQILQIKK